MWRAIVFVRKSLRRSYKNINFAADSETILPTELDEHFYETGKQTLSGSERQLHHAGGYQRGQEMPQLQSAAV